MAQFNWPLTPYAWDEEQCQTLWDDIFTFSFPNNDYEALDKNDEYFLGSIVTFKNDDEQSEVIDSQQTVAQEQRIKSSKVQAFWWGVSQGDGIEAAELANVRGAVGGLGKSYRFLRACGDRPASLGL